jgi:hypothetical protein
MDLYTASEVVDIALQSIQGLREQTKFHEVFSSLNINEALLLKKRKVSLANHLHNSIVMEKLPVYTNHEQFLMIYNGIIDNIVNEIKARFSAGNISLLKSLKALVSFEHQSSEDLEYLANLSNIYVREMKGEIDTAIAFLQKKASENVTVIFNILLAFCRRILLLLITRMLMKVNFVLIPSENVFGTSLMEVAEFILLIGRPSLMSIIS